jgi:hypothetical protein
MDVRVNAARLKEDLEELGAIGRTAEGGVSRPSWSEANAVARVPSKDGRSHVPMEYTADADVEHGANVLLLTLLKLAA